ncbi:MAG: hypothetical protein A2790_03210 [Phenylobacterium sp. RIFCSPHIGHO2_01_FULL_69_31]|uniref:PIN domain-containing protein n=1 Tax=Phenylobacterium sp. RIFCSPHIGHO2_01_FULL_69_31 TaxID=1801944 RepID=UPI0008AD8DE4|nr:PIN domain-containing protein [Phenylobacterium sp. RIFCSPHIGHO2_01_FULL_69_31]OHB31830.1 MAG: hypothetical protein A2790_03210 [Phenylobacterium sp. RIFCSPHIGHO2_01_FULL_69_31]
MEPSDPFKTKAFLDTNIVLECRDLPELPWAEVDAEGPILLLVTARVAQEVDMRKRDGRLASRARAFNKVLGEAVVSGQPVVIRESGPHVALARSTASRIPWSDHDDLDPDEADHRIIAEVLHAKDVGNAEKVVVSHDVNPLGLARDHGLRVHHVGEHWLRPPEPSPMEKEVQRLKGRLSVLEARSLNSTSPLRSRASALCRCCRWNLWTQLAGRLGYGA